jgi:hypothetical protein
MSIVKFLECDICRCLHQRNCECAKQYRCMHRGYAPSAGEHTSYHCAGARPSMYFLNTHIVYNNNNNIKLTTNLLYKAAIR